MAQQDGTDRYEPLPGLVSLPRWIWRKLPDPAKAALVVLVFALIGVLIVIGPDIQRSKDERERADRQERLEARAEREARIRRQQRPRFRSGPAAPSRVPARRRLLESATASALADSRARAAAGELRGTIEAVECEPFPRSVDRTGAENSTEERFGRYACLAVTARFAPTEETTGGSIGHPYRMRIDFQTGRYAFCKISGRPGEGLLERRLAVTVPRVCGGGP